MCFAGEKKLGTQRARRTAAEVAEKNFLLGNLLNERTISGAVAANVFFIQGLRDFNPCDK
jgi:hypothetical protein